MLYISGKFLEKDLESFGSFSTNIGVRKRRSTIGTILEIVTKVWSINLKSRKFCLLLIMDVKNAFNNEGYP